MSTTASSFAIGDRVLFGAHAGVVTWQGSLENATIETIYCGITLDKPVGSSDGSYKGHRYFKCATNQAVFVPVSSVQPFSEEGLAAVKIQASFRGSLTRRNSKKGNSPLKFLVGRIRPEATSAAEQLRQEAKEASVPPAKRSLNSMSDVAAALMIQRVLRGKEGRERAKRLRLWKVWNALDTKEESELVHTHGSYEDLKSLYNETIDAEAKEARACQPLPMVTGDLPTQMEGDVPRCPQTMNLDFVTAVMDHFKHDGLLHVDDVRQIIGQVKPLLQAHSNIVQVTVHNRMTVVGDIHGQLDDMFTIFKLNGLPSLRNSYLFNGDFVDRGQNSVECILVLFLFKLLYPDNFFLNRGNHEAKDINSRDGFEKECLSKYGLDVFDMFADAFACLPLATTLNGAVFVVHGGMCWDDLTFEQINAIDRFHEIPPPDSYMEQMIWSDPQEKPGREDNPRGCSLVYGPDVVERFLDTNNLDMVIRSHECQAEGYEKLFDGQLITVFSASNYCGVVGNEGAFVIFNKNMHYKIVQYCSKPKEKMSRYRMRHALIENDVISKLLRRIAENRLALVDCYSKLDKKNKGAISRAQWAAGLKQVLGIDIPFLEFQGYLGLPKLGVSGKEQGRVDYMAFLDRYRIRLAVGGEENNDDSNGAKETTQLTQDIQEAMDQLANLLFQKRYELESLFRYFDANGDGVITLAELSEGIRSLRSVLKHPITDTQIDKVVEYMDKNSDGVVAYSEFFASFEVQDAKLAQAQKKAEDHRNKRRGPHL